MIKLVVLSVTLGFGDRQSALIRGGFLFGGIIFLVPING